MHVTFALAAITWQTMGPVVLMAIACSFALFGLYAAEGLFKHGGIRRLLQRVTFAVGATIFVAGWVVGFALSIQYVVTQIGGVFSSPMTPITGLQRFQVISAVVFIVGIFVIGVPASTVYERMKASKLKHVIGGGATTIVAAIAVLVLLNAGVGHILDLYDDFVSAPRALFLIVLGIVSIAYLIHLIFGEKEVVKSGKWGTAQIRFPNFRRWRSTSTAESQSESESRSEDRDPPPADSHPDQL